ncbi:hypothetical protein V6U90_27835 [Micromonospora sp. CPCC 206060]|uniref:hypothetical protein n=1 Tax=Micromonospora sp. CPCC 206060 TaxID=3122406 RepID=UPI002FEECA17
MTAPDPAPAATPGPEATPTPEPGPGPEATPTVEPTPGPGPGPAGTRAVPDLPPGTVLRLARTDWRYGRHTLFLRVRQVRHDLSVYYDGEWIWITGQQLGRDGTPLGPIDALVRVTALQHGTLQHGTLHDSRSWSCGG